MPFITISFYKYTPIDTQEKLREYFKALCEKLNLTGRILIAAEGINAAVSGKKENIEEFKKIIIKNSLFSNLTFREQDAGTQAHHKLVVRVRNEIVHFGKKVNMPDIGIHLSPSQLQQWYVQREDFVIVDARNEYEHKVGKFKNAVTLPIKNFREFPDAAQQLTQYKDKKMVLYCTGGIRCEKASAYLKQQGFEQVYQIDGGIINYVNQYPDSQWEGGLFVFDNRLVSDVGEPITHCQFCQTECEQYHNCFNLDCDTLFIGCKQCVESMKSTCSVLCKNAPRQRKHIKPRTRIGIIHHYYPHAKVALLKVEQELNKSLSFIIAGKTTAEFSYTMSELRNESGEQIEKAFPGEMVTFPLAVKVRKNDLAFVAVR